MKRKKGVNFKKLRASLGFTQEEMSELIGVSQAAIDGYEKDRYMPKYKTVSNIMMIVSDYNLDFKIEDFIE